MSTASRQSCSCLPEEHSTHETQHPQGRVRLSLRFLASPAAIVPDANGRIAKLVIAENEMVVKENGSTAAIPTRERREIEVDTLIFAIGDKHDAGVGLPMGTPLNLPTTNQQLQNALPSLQPAIAMLNLVKPGLQRGAQELPETKLNSGTKTLHVEVALSSRTPVKYRVQLLHTRTMIWSQDGVDAAAVAGGAILRLDIPADVLTQGTNELVVMPSGDGAISYWFSVSKLQ